MSLRIWSANGQLDFDTSTSTYRIVVSALVSFEVGGRTTKTFDAPVCNSSNAVCFMLPINNNNDANFPTNRQLECEMGNGVVYVRNFLPTNPNNSIAQSTMRLIIARWA